MKVQSYTFFLIFLIVSLTGCEKVIKFKGDLAERKLVINSDFNPSENWEVNLSYSLGISEVGNPGPVEDATVEIKDASGQLITTLLHDSAGFYRSTNLMPQANTVYQVAAKANGYKTVNATASTPDQVIATVTDTTSGIFLSDEVLIVDIEIEDPDDKENYYILEANFVYTDSFGGITEERLWIYSLDPNQENTVVGEENVPFDKIFIPDLAFQGQTYKTQIQISMGYIGFLLDFSPEEIVDLQLNIKTRSVGKEMYLYLKSYEKYKNYSGDPTFSQPVQVYSNVENGFGVFGGSTEVVTSYEIE